MESKKTTLTEDEVKEYVKCSKDPHTSVRNTSKLSP